MIRFFSKHFLSNSIIFSRPSFTGINKTTMHWHSTIGVEQSVSNHNNRLRLMEDDYCSDHSTPFSIDIDQLMNELALETIKEFSNAHMMNSKTATLLLRQWIHLFQPKRTLEIGTFTGYSTLAMAAALDEQQNTINDTLLVSLEKDNTCLQMASRYLERAGLLSKVKFMQGDAFDSLVTLANEKIPFDLIFIDADKGGYIKYYDFILENNMLADNGVILADNVLYFGQVHRTAGYPEDQPIPASKNINKMARKVHAFNEHVRNDDRVQSVTLPIFDGLTIIKKKKKKNLLTN
ncbi:O-methyltransferase-domain-containing protein [Halteromyces radiatus]|uniref:O-methyltransferase-domain-containing protein n=1 Tax=Halteromyces radiatus TaxID=101107 RepID=UPI002220D600|nr:O-methyltransferase-domain-containing protein [Halteromyces radiatus]KAI8099626.1 O-methyltransferase-domain-containing protein [Halteromyces radiatus]